MENVLFKGDVILVNKLSYGPRLPRSPFDIPLFNIAFLFNDNARQRINENWWSYKRFSGTTKIKKGDIFVFNSTWKKDFVIVKRCIGLPGDTITIKNAAVFTNNNTFIEPISVKNNYKFKVKNEDLFYKTLDAFHNEVVLKRSDKEGYDEAQFTKSQIECLNKKHCLDAIEIQIDTFIPEKVFVKLPSLKWTFDNMGPIIVPIKGMKVELNKETFSLYKRAINSSEDVQIKEINGLYYINEKKSTHYIFKQDYFFMMGDNRKGTMDSRRWGFVPKSNIIGKVQCVLYSNHGGEFNWKRFLKLVN